MSAVGVSAELYITQIGHPPNLSQTGQHVGRYPIVHGQTHHCVAARRVACDLHAGDVDVVRAQGWSAGSAPSWASTTSTSPACRSHATRMVPTLPTTPGRSSWRLTRKR